MLQSFAQGPRHALVSAPQRALSGNSLSLWSKVFGVLVATHRKPHAQMPARTALQAPAPRLDDLLLLLRTVEAEAGAALTVALFGALNASISWKKAQFSQHVVWCGWKFCFASESVQLVAHKMAKLREQLQALHAAHKVPRKSLEAALGLLNWATTFSKHLRPFMAPLYKDLRSAKGTLHSMAPAAWSAFSMMHWIARQSCHAHRPVAGYLATHSCSRWEPCEGAQQSRRPQSASVKQAPVGTPSSPRNPPSQRK